MRRAFAFVVLPLWLALASPALKAIPQDQDEKKTEAPKPETLFSGTVIECTKERLTVSRKVLGKTQKRTFRLTPDTKYEGDFKVKVWVTVRYVVTDDGETAESIIVRAQQKKK
jgi:hypothetical protein